MFRAAMNQNEIEQVHQTTLNVLDNVGIVFSYEPALEVLAKAGCKVDGQRAYIPSSLVEWAVRQAPSHFTLYARNEEKNLVIGGEGSVYLPANCPPFVTDLDQGRRYGTGADYENFVKLTYSSQNVDMVSAVPVEPTDIPVEIRHRWMMLSCLRYSDQCFMSSGLHGQAGLDCLEMAKMVWGPDSLAEKARVIAIPCSLTPLSYDDNMLSCLMAYCAENQPVLINSLAIAGATAPATMAGTLVVQNAEILAGVILAQLVREGCPVVYASGSTNADMRTGSLCVGSPEMALLTTMSAQMARYYDIPSRGVGALNDSKMCDAQAGWESMMVLNNARQSGINFILHAAGALESINCMSYEKFIIDDEMIGMVKRLDRGAEINTDTLAEEVIAAVGPQGHFLSQPHTLMNFRKEFYMPQITDRSPFEGWEREGAEDAAIRANRRWKSLLESYEEPELPAKLKRDLEKYCQA